MDFTDGVLHDRSQGRRSLIIRREAIYTQEQEGGATETLRGGGFPRRGAEVLGRGTFWVLERLSVGVGHAGIMCVTLHGAVNLRLCVYLFYRGNTHSLTRTCSTHVCECV